MEEERRTAEKHYRIFRLVVTDSGHYILPTGYEQTESVAKETKKEIVLFSQKVAEESRKQWDDVHERVRHCFLNYKGSIDSLQPRGDRGESNDTANVNDLDKGNYNNNSADSSDAKVSKIHGNGDLVLNRPPSPEPVQPRSQPDSLRPQNDSVPIQPVSTTSAHDQQHIALHSVQSSPH